MVGVVSMAFLETKLNYVDLANISVAAPFIRRAHDEICPHGRPIVKRLRLADLLREFGRL